MRRSLDVSNRRRRLVELGPPPLAFRRRRFVFRARPRQLATDRVDLARRRRQFGLERFFGRFDLAELANGLVSLPQHVFKRGRVQRLQRLGAPQHEAQRLPARRFASQRGPIVEFLPRRRLLSHRERGGSVSAPREVLMRHQVEAPAFASRDVRQGSGGCRRGALVRDVRRDRRDRLHVRQVHALGAVEEAVGRGVRLGARVVARGFVDAFEDGRVFFNVRVFPEVVLTERRGGHRARLALLAKPREVLLRASSLVLGELDAGLLLPDRRAKRRDCWRESVRFGSSVRSRRVAPSGGGDER